RGNMEKSGVLFRPRFLWKSHIPTDSADGHLFGCLFCVSTGSVTREDDATVFRSEEALLRHLSRHPQPLPLGRLAGLTVLYGHVEPDDPLVEDYDLFFPDGPTEPVMPSAATLSRLPVATATRDHLQRPGEKPLADPDGLEALHFLKGAR